jgi:hypothetical protein
MAKVGGHRWLPIAGLATWMAISLSGCTAADSRPIQLVAPAHLRT